MYISRILRKTLSRSLSRFPSVLMTGPSQSGKTTFVQAEHGKHMEYVNFDDPLQQSYATEDPKGLLKSLEERPAILDEIKYMPELLVYLKMDIDEHRNYYGCWVLTGSQQFGLME